MTGYHLLMELARVAGRAQGPSCAAAVAPADGGYCPDMPPVL